METVNGIILTEVSYFFGIVVPACICIICLVILWAMERFGMIRMALIGFGIKERETKETDHLKEWRDKEIALDKWESKIFVSNPKLDKIING